MHNMNHHPAGTPCWIESWQPDPDRAGAFYEALFGWRLDPVAPGGRRVARLADRAVGAISQAPGDLPTGVWTTHVSVADADAAVKLAVGAGGSVLMPPTDAGEDGRLALVIDPGGVVVGVWQAGALAGAEAVDVSGAWAMSSLHTPSLERAAEFYGTMFGWRLDVSPAWPVALWRLPGHDGGRSDGLPGDTVAVATAIVAGESVPPHWAVSVHVTDADAIAANAAALGGRVLLAPTTGPGFRSAVITDPAGAALAVNAPLG